MISKLVRAFSLVKTLCRPNWRGKMYLAR